MNGMRAFGVALAIAGLGALAWLALRRPLEIGPQAQEVPTAAIATARSEPSPAVVREAVAPAKQAPVDLPSVPAATAPVVIHGTVVDERGAPIAGAKVALASGEREPEGIALGLPSAFLDSGRDAVDADEHGRFEQRLAEPGPFELIATHELHPPSRVSGRADGPLVEGVVITLRAGGSISGKVSGAPDDAGELRVVAREIEGASGVAPQAWIDVSGLLDGLDLPIGARTTEVLADRSFRLLGLTPGASYLVFAVRAEARCTNRVDVREGASGVELRWRPTFSLALRVVDAETGAAIEELDVSVGPVRRIEVLGMSVPAPLRRPIAQRRFAGGEVLIEGIALDDGDEPRLSIELRAAAHRTWTRDDLAGDGQGRMDLGVVALEPAPVVRVHVVDTAGNPIQGAELALESTAPAGVGPGLRVSTTIRATADQGDSAKSVRTDEQGVAEIGADHGGEAKLMVRSAQHAPLDVKGIDVPPRGVIEREVVLLAGGRARVRARDGHGAPLPHAKVERSSDVVERDTETLAGDADGELVFERLAPGTHRLALVDGAARAHQSVRVASSFARQDVVSVTIHDGATSEVELVHPLRGRLRGIVTLNGQPLDHASVRVVEARDADPAAAAAEAAGRALGALFGDAAPEPLARTDADGAYTIDGVRVGPGSVAVEHEDLAMTVRSTLNVVEGENVHDVAIRGAVLRGRVIGDDGAALEGVSIEIAEAAGDRTGAPDTGEVAALIAAALGSGERATARTDADGRFELRGVPAGVALRVSAHARLRLPDTVLVEALAASAVREGLELRLAAAGRVSVRARGETAAMVTATWAGGEPVPKGAASARTALLRSRRTVIDGLAPGRWRFALGDAEQFVDVVAGRTSSFEF